MCPPPRNRWGCSLQGVLGQAKNGDQVFWEEKFHAANGKAQACIQGFSFYVLEGGGGRRERERERDFLVIFPGFPMYVPFRFP